MRVLNLIQKKIYFILGMRPVSGTIFLVLLIYNRMAWLQESIYRLFEQTRIHISTSVDPSANIDNRGIVIRDTCCIGKKVVITGRVHIGRNTTIRNNAVIGTPGFQIFRLGTRRLPIAHTGMVRIHDHVTIDEETCIDRGLFGKKTEIGPHSSIGRESHIGHNIIIGPYCQIGEKVTIGGNTIIGDRVVIGNDAVLSNRITIASGTIIAAGTTVTHNIT